MSKLAIILEYNSFRHQKRTIEGHKPSCPHLGRIFSKSIKTHFHFSIFSRCVEISLTRPQHLKRKTILGLNIIPVVNASKAPSFKRFRHANREVRKALGLDSRITRTPIFGFDMKDAKVTEVKQAMQELLEGLVDNLQAGKYSARDQSWSRSTLLHIRSILVS